MIQAFDHWYRLDNPEIKIVFLNDIVRWVVGGSPQLCIFHKNCHRYLTLSPTGDIFGCSRLAHVDRFTLGNIQDTGLIGILSSPAYQRYQDLVSRTPEKCQPCKWQGICQGGCLAHRYISNDSTGEDNYFCAAYQEVFSYIKERVSETLLFTG
jgi:uncharacterized protein